MGRFLGGVGIGVAIAALGAVAVLYFADLEIVDREQPPAEAAPEGVTVPDVVGMSKDDGRATIEGIGLNVRFVSETGSGVDWGDPARITRQVPAAGTESEPGWNVTLYWDYASG